MLGKYLGVSNVAEYLGVEKQTVYQWITRHGPESSSRMPMPMPAVAVVQGTRVKSGVAAVTYGWAASQLADIRRWYADLKGWDEVKAAHHWVEVDALLREKDNARNARG